MSNREIVEVWFEQLWNRADPSTIDRLLAPDARVHGLGPQPIVGHDFHQFYTSFREAFPEVHVTLEQIVESGDLVAVNSTVRVLPRGHSEHVTFTGSCTARIAGGKIVEGWNYFDFLTLLVQLGAVPANIMEQELTSLVAG